MLGSGVQVGRVVCVACTGVHGAVGVEPQGGGNSSPADKGVQVCKGPMLGYLWSVRSGRPRGTGRRWIRGVLPSLALNQSVEALGRTYPTRKKKISALQEAKTGQKPARSPAAALTSTADDDDVVAIAEARCCRAVSFP